jgi:hypothetical protein
MFMILVTIINKCRAMQRKAKGRETDKHETPVKRTTSAVNCMLIDDPTD